MSYRVLLADPPWRYEFSKSKSRKIENQYPTMSIAEICALPVADMVGTDCVLFLWAVAPKVPEAIEVMRAWGFTYKTCGVWDKELIGMGYYFRGQHELILVGTRGTPGVSKPSDRRSSVIRSRRGRHSAKPVELHEAIEKMYPEGRKLEMFARQARPGWDVWGNEVQSDVSLAP